MVDEPVPGLSRARNAGASAARGKFLIYLDDDALAVPEWLDAYHTAFTCGHKVVQGRILVEMATPRPPWLREKFLSMLSHFDLGKVEGVESPILIGANFGLTRAVFERIGPFNEQMGSGVTGFGEDNEYALRVRGAGLAIAYSPRACVRHLIPANRLTRRAMLRRFYSSGLSQPLFQRYDDPLFRMILSLAKTTVLGIGSALFTLDGGQRMEELFQVCEHAGRVRQILRLRLCRKTENEVSR